MNRRVSSQRQMPEMSNFTARLGDGTILDEAYSYAFLEEAYRCDPRKIYLRNEVTGVEWWIHPEDEDMQSGGFHDASST